MKRKPSVRYHNILRAIGQGLENLNVNSFDLLESSENEFVVAGDCSRTKARSGFPLSPKKSFLSLFRTDDKRKTTRNSSLKRFNFVGVRFTDEEIELLDRKGKLLRSKDSSSTPNPTSIAQILRVTGGYLDYKRGRLLGLSWRDQIVTLWYINGLGAEVKEDFTPADLYDVWVRQLKKRTPLSRLKPTGSD